MKRFILGVLITISSPSLLCQTTAYQDANGNTSIYLSNAKASLIYNVSDSKFNIGYLYEPATVKKEDFTDQLARAKEKLNQALVDAVKTIGQSADTQAAAKKAVADAQLEVDTANSNIANAKKLGPCARCEYGLNVFGKPSTNLSGQILQNSNSPANVGGGGLIGVHGLFVKDIFDQTGKEHLHDDWFLVNISYSRSTFSTVATGSAAPIAQHFNGFTILPVYNAVYSIPGFGLLAGVGVGVNRTDNAGDLTKVQISTVQASSGSVSVVSQKDAYLGAYQESIGVPVYSDFIFIPKSKLNWLSIDAFERANVVSTNGYSEGGVGVFFAQPEKPTKVLGGLSVDWKNGKREVAIVAGWTF